MAADGGSLAVSIGCVVASSLIITFGLLFQKIAQQRRLALENVSQGSKVIANKRCFRCWTCVYWFLGFLCITIISFPLDLYSMATLGQSLVVPLRACLAVAWNQVLAPMLLGEQFDRCRDTAATALVVLGAICTTLFGPGGPFSGTTVDPAPEMDYAEMKEYFAGLFLAPVFLIFEALTIALLAVCFALPRIGCCEKLHFLLLGYVAGCLGGQQTMFVKGVGTSLGTGFGGDPSVFGDWIVYVFVFFMVTLASLQLFFLNRGLARFQALIFLPTYTILFIVNGTLVGLVFYQEYKLMSNTGWVMFCVGFLFIAASMYILALKKEKPPMYILACKKENPPADEIQVTREPTLVAPRRGTAEDVLHTKALTPTTPLPPSTPAPPTVAVFSRISPAEPPSLQSKLRRAAMKVFRASPFNKRSVVLPTTVGAADCGGYGEGPRGEGTAGQDSSYPACDCAATGGVRAG